MKYIKMFEDFKTENSVNESNKTFTIVVDRVNNRGTRSTNEYVGTLEELITQFSYDLQTGQAYETEDGNSKINMFPKNIKALVLNLNKAATNSSATGSPNKTYSYF